MILFDRNTNDEIVVVAEIGVNHEGSLAWVFEIMPRLKEADVDAVKLQLYTPEFFVSPRNKERFGRVSSYALTRNQFELIYKFGQSINLPVFATPVSHDWVDYVAERCGVVKIASGDFNFQPTVIRSLESNAKVILSTGATRREEILQFLTMARQIRSDDVLKEQLALLHCVSAYPPNLEEANLKAIPDLRKITGLEVGFSSHFMDDAPIYGAVCLGARILEIHVTLDRQQSNFRDHALSRTPNEMQIIVSCIRKIDKALKSEIKQLQPSEESLVTEIRKGFIYAHPLKSGHRLVESDISYARPASKQFRSSQELLGKTLNQDVEAYDAILFEHFE